MRCPNGSVQHHIRRFFQIFIFKPASFQEKVLLVRLMKVHYKKLLVFELAHILS